MSTLPARWDVPSLWDILRAEQRPIFLYGTGNGGDKIIDVCESRGIRITGVFASDGFVRNRVFRDMPVQAYSDVTAAWGNDIVILLAFGTTLPDVTGFIDMLDRRHTLYIPEVPLYGGVLFDRDVLFTHLDRLTTLHSLFADEHSQLLFEDAILFRLTGKRCYLRRTTEPKEDIAALCGPLLPKILLDGGAFRGDSAEMYISALPSLEIVHAAEADSRTVRHLTAYAERETRASVIPHHCALWKEDGELTYTSSASRGSGTAGQNHRAKTVTVPACTIDTLLGNGTDRLLLKLDVEGAEKEALTGAGDTIGTCRPAMALSLYHRTEDLWELPLWVHDRLPEKKLYLRRPACIPFWDLTLFAV